MTKQSFLSGDGESAKLIRSIDWSKTSLGNPISWPQSLRTSVSLCLASKSPILLYCGHEYVRIYNDAYCELIAAKHSVSSGANEKDELRDVWPTPKAQLDRVMQTGEAVLCEDQLPVLDGNSNAEERSFTFSYSPIFDELNNVIGVFAIISEATQKVLNENHLTRLLTSLFVKAPIAICIIRSANNVIDFANEFMLSLWGKTVEEVMYKPALEVIPDFDRTYKEIITQVSSTGERFVSPELPARVNRNGKIENIFVKCLFEPLHDNTGIVSVVVFMEDEITDQETARQKLQEVSARFETMANNIPHLAWIANADGWIFWYNNRWYEYTGTTSKDMEGWGWQSVHDPATLPAVLRQWQLSINTGLPFDMVFPLKSADNVFHPFLTRVIPIRNSNGEVIQWIGTNTDITKQKELEQMKDDFLSIASHELKTPVTSMKVSLHMAEEMVKKDDHCENISPFIEKANRQVNKLTSLIDELLDVTKIQLGNLNLNISRFTFLQSLNEWIDQARMATDKHQIILEGSEEIIVEGDKIRLEQVVMNFLYNAIKYSPSAGKIIVTLSNEIEHVKVSVSDYGFGISSDMLPFVFDRFFRTHRAQNFSGLGLGLYISSEIIKRHGGNIGVTSKENEGSCFWFVIPLKQKKDR